MHTLLDRLDRRFERLESITMVQAVRSGLVMAIPVLLVGSFALVLRNLPIEAYQAFLGSFLNGFLAEIFAFIYNGTYGMLSLIMTLTISVSYTQLRPEALEYVYGPPITALACFAVSSGLLTDGFTIEAFGVKGLFTAILSGVAAPWLYRLIARRVTAYRFYTDGADVTFNNAITAILPTLLVVLLFVVVNALLDRLFAVSCLQELFTRLVGAVFNGAGRSLFSALLFVVVSSLLWFFGIHGGDVLEQVSKTIFEGGMDVNIQAVAAGQPATEIFTKTFLDVFVLMGGCGTTLCILIAILLFSRQRATRGLSKMAVFPMLFNINELMVFGLPIVFNPILLVPFVLTPVVLTLISTAAVVLGLVPVPMQTVDWTTPVLFGGYLATGSVAGILLQLFNLAVGVCIYAPFVRVLDREKSRRSQTHIQELRDVLEQCEQNNTPVTLTALHGACGMIAKMLAADLKHAIAHEELELYYQPQCNAARQCFGAEALLRWKHPLFGMVYPPLVVKVADETGSLPALERWIFKSAADALVRMQAADGSFRLSVNASAKAVADPELFGYLDALLQTRRIAPGTFCLEITEQMALQFHDAVHDNIQRLLTRGVPVAIDDFSMGSTSLRYLQENPFSEVKLDGSLVRDLLHNPRCKDIISSIVYLSRSLGFSVVAEYVETAEQQAALQQLGCEQYQGYLYSPAVPLEDLLRFLLQ